MKGRKIIEIRNHSLTIIVIVLLFIITGLTGFIILKNTLLNSGREDNNDISYNKEDMAKNIINKSISPTQIKTYSVNVYTDQTSEKNYKIGKNFNVNVKIDDIKEDRINYSFKINNSEFPYTDYIKIEENVDIFTLVFYKVGNYYAFENTGKEDVRNTHIYIFDILGNLYTDLFSIGDIEDKDMYIEGLRFTEHQMIIDTSRITSDLQIIYDNRLYSMGEDDLSDIPENTSVKIQYKYNISISGSINFENPEKKILDSMGEFVERNR